MSDWQIATIGASVLLLILAGVIYAIEVRRNGR